MVQQDWRDGWIMGAIDAIMYIYAMVSWTSESTIHQVNFFICTQHVGRLVSPFSAVFYFGQQPLLHRQLDRTETI